MSMSMSPETGAHLTDVLSRRSPSLFEILSQQNLTSGLHSAFEHVVKVLASEQPERSGWLFRNKDEIYLLFNAAIQYHYLKTRGGTLSESFYGIQRLSTATSSTHPINASLLIEVLSPYCQSKIQQTIQEYETEEGTSNETRRRATVLKYYHHLVGVLTLVKLYFYVMYILDKSKSHSLIFALCGWKLVYSDPESQPNSGLNFTSWRHTLFSLGEMVLPVIEFGSFFVQFLNWWNHEKRREFDVKPVPEPYDGNYNLDKTKCPICNQPRRNNTALRTSGIVYCYGCISKYLNQIHKCPITGIPSSVQDLVRIYS